MFAVQMHYNIICVSDLAYWYAARQGAHVSGMTLILHVTVLPMRLCLPQAQPHIEAALRVLPPLQG